MIICSLVLVCNRAASSLYVMVGNRIFVVKLGDQPTHIAKQIKDAVQARDVAESYLVRYKQSCNPPCVVTGNRFATVLQLVHR